MRKLMVVLIVLLLGSLALATKSIPCGATKQRFTVVLRNSSGEPNTAPIAGTNLKMWIIKDGNVPTAKYTLAADTCHYRASGVYDINIPEHWTDGTNATYGDCYTIVIDSNAVTANNAFNKSYYEIQISPPVDITSAGQSSTAAANLKLMFDGTGYIGGTTKLRVRDANGADLAVYTQVSNIKDPNSNVRAEIKHVSSGANVASDSRFDTLDSAIDGLRKDANDILVLDGSTFTAIPWNTDWTLYIPGSDPNEIWPYLIPYSKGWYLRKIYRKPIGD